MGASDLYLGQALVKGFYSFYDKAYKKLETESDDAVKEFLRSVEPKTRLGKFFLWYASSYTYNALERYAKIRAAKDVLEKRIQDKN